MATPADSLEASMTTAFSKLPPTSSLESAGVAVGVGVSVDVGVGVKVGPNNCPGPHAERKEPNKIQMERVRKLFFMKTSIYLGRGSGASEPESKESVIVPSL